MIQEKFKPLRIYKASAGSGKTFTLAVEYISLLAINPMEYQNILAVTFTNKATAEMKQRILGTLYGIANALPSAEAYIEPILASVKSKINSPQYDGLDKESIIIKDKDTLRDRAKEALSNIIHDYSRFHVETIDSFFQSILHEIASELDLSVNMRVELDDIQALSDAVDTIIENLKEGSSEFRSIISFINEKIHNNNSWKVDATVKDFGTNIFKENYLIHGDDVRSAITNVNKIHSYRTMINAGLEEKKKSIIDLASNMLNLCEEIELVKGGGAKSICTFLGKVAEYNNVKEPTGNNRGTFSDTIETFTYDADKWFNKSAKKKDILLPEVEEKLMPMLRKLFTLHDSYTSHAHTVKAITQHLYSLMLLNKISETIREQNNEKSRFLLSETANFLRDVINGDDIPFIYEKAGSVIKHIMIDEFQDTSTLQWGNFKPLIMNCIAADGSCLIVGDVKQSIYRFRNSDWMILNNIEQDTDLRNMISNIPAQYNYRSSRHVVEFNNELFRKAVAQLAERCPNLTTAYGDVAQIAKKDKEKGFVRVENIDYHDVKDEDDDDLWNYDISPAIDEAMLQRIKANVTELVNEGVAPNDITILTRTNNEVPIISDYFIKHPDDCPVRVVSDDAFRLDASPAIVIIINALRVLASNSNRLHLTCLAYHYAKYVLHQDNPLSITLCDTTAIEQHLPAGFRLHERERLNMKSLVELTEDIYSIFHIETMEGQDAYMLCFHDMLERFCVDNQASVSLFLQKWDDKLKDTTIPNGASDGVRIMTIHKSKGLEFHTVIVPSCMWDIKPKDKEVMWCMPDVCPYNEMPLLPISVSRATDDSIFADDRHMEELKTLVDNINMLYVAFTRAKHNLIILTGNKMNNQVKNSITDINTPSCADDSTTTNEDTGLTAINRDIDTAQVFVIKSLPDNMQATEASNDVMTQWQYGAIVSSEANTDAADAAGQTADCSNVEDSQNGKQDKAAHCSNLPNAQEENGKRNMLECDYAPLNVSFVSNSSVAEFRQSYESDMFITADADDMKTKQHQEKIRLISLGNLYHNIFQMIHTPSDVPHAIRMLEAKGCFEALVEADEAQETVANLIEGISATHPEWFSNEWRVLNERTILFSQDDLYATKRPDRVIVNGRQAIVIDYKTARGVVKRDKNGLPHAPSENVSQITDYKHLLNEIGYRDIKAYLWYIFDDAVIEVNA